MSDYTFITTEEHFLLQDALKKNKQQLIKFGLIGFAVTLVVATIPQVYLYTHNNMGDADDSMLSYKNLWFWIWLMSFVIALIFSLIKLTDIRYWAIKKDLTALQKATLQAPMEAVYIENNDSQTNIMLAQNQKKRLYYWMRGALDGYRAGQEVEITYARYSRVIISINKL
ncbi:hypothetical protein SAMN05660909_02422 [Chitinophaga terrae (ex Kim and Jung 2007)]|uniref:Uncharacterized protein n=1 Tax=Chitinophaga terrae (ex Kim and Jung 2007) TaxID=408074 RepID=A0A1H4C388_9BACT|nr:hypothetical protein [Chitinophaga terrae (ex Kim and Jung 2007)]MDQ0108521.1 hypothetical protein [Chitinophaga terrae (ex Kim and Jung 2007)]GEP92189.1 hypothetical protein CTE07_38340 [Chitinophaga terrae (ex Kim and Jung 2007)]SEA54814.1 hypothetical protein SAMN05660909_02422 [Chitinophaga terrae (ex Kim and Jung 2007)]